MLQLPAELSSRLDLALWSPAATARDYEALCAGARKLQARAVCVPSSRVSLACARLEDAAVKVVGLAGFPLGNSDSDVKRFEAEAAIDNGAQEIELVLNHIAVTEDPNLVLRELRDVVESVDELPVYVAIELPRLTREAIVHLCHLSLDAGIAGLCTGTGFYAPPLAIPEHITLVREATSAKFLIKAAPIADTASADTFITAGANRLGVVFSNPEP